MNSWINAEVLKIKKWTSNLFTLILKAHIKPFLPGQFTKLALFNNEKKIQRAYSYLSPPRKKNLEIYIVRVLNGKLSNLLYNLKKGDNIFIKKYGSGFFLLEEIPKCQTLWMFATGTGISPYLSILQEGGNNINKFNHIILIHAVRYAHELVYLPLMNKLHKKYNGKLTIQTITSREIKGNSLTGRIPFLLKNGSLEKNIGFFINNKNSHVMLCGNPEMIRETYNFLKENRNMKKHLRREKGNITMENYW